MVLGWISLYEVPPLYTVLSWKQFEYKHILCLLEELVCGNTREEMASQNVYTHTYIMCLYTICLCVRAIYINTHTPTQV